MRFKAASLALLVACAPEASGSSHEPATSEPPQEAATSEPPPKTFVCMFDKTEWGNCGSGIVDIHSHRECFEVASPDDCPIYDFDYDHSAGCGLGSKTEPVETSDLSCDALDWHGGWSGSVIALEREYFSTSVLSFNDSVSVGAKGLISAPWEDGSREDRTFEGFDDLLGVWAASLDEVFIVGRGGLLMKGSIRLNTFSSWMAGADVRSVHGRSPDDVWAVGSHGAAYHFEDDTVVEWHTGVEDDLNAVWVAPNGEVWAVGANGIVVRFDATQASVLPTGTQTALLAVHGTSPTDVWVTGEQGTILHFDGSSWTDVPGAFDRLTFTGVRAMGPREVHFSSDDGLYRWNGFELRWRREGSYNAIDGMILSEPGREGDLLLRAKGKTSCWWNANERD